MAGSKTTQGSAFTLDLIFGLNGKSSPFTSFELALLTGVPGEAGDLQTEVSGNGYERLEVVVGDAHWVREGTSVANLNDLEFPEASGNWGEVLSLAIIAKDGADDTVFYHSTFNSSRTVVADTAVRFKTGELVISEY